MRKYNSDFSEISNFLNKNCIDTSNKNCPAVEFKNVCFLSLCLMHANNSVQNQFYLSVYILS